MNSKGNTIAEILSTVSKVNPLDAQPEFEFNFTVLRLPRFIIEAALMLAIAAPVILTLTDLLLERRVSLDDR
jgi:hypothetical protein